MNPNLVEMKPEVNDRKKSAIPTSALYTPRLLSPKALKISVFDE